MGTLDVEFGVVNADNVEQLKKIDQACFPVTYNQKYYDGLVKKPDEDLVKFAYFGGLAVGAIATRIEDIPKSPGRQRIYIMTLGVLAAYRGRGIGTKLVQTILDLCEREMDGKLECVDEILLHVQTSNVDAIKFYTERFNFEKGELLEGYYKRIEPPDCYIIRKRLR